MENSKEAKVLFTLRIHLDDNTVDHLTGAPTAMMAEAESVIKTGVWVGNKLYPPHRVVYCEIV